MDGGPRQRRGLSRSAVFRRWFGGAPDVSSDSQILRFSDSQILMFQRKMLRHIKWEDF